MRRRVLRSQLVCRLGPRLGRALCALTVTAVVATGSARADSKPVGPLPPRPVSTIVTQKGELVAVALPNRSGGRVWRIARAFDSKIVAQVSEADVGSNVVLVFRAKGTGTTMLAFGLTRGETAKAFDARRFKVQVR
jgi:hypothetical protein